ncbi:restriction endonuclease subunit S [Lacibacter sp. H375]|uniref:restriction endonuclease subunit S n=1 Tax=Lacibacter sp. H375 TaxID=3133424 RepID=UPI0030C30A2C
MSDLKEFFITDFADILNAQRIPLSSMERSKRKGIYPYYGASGIIDSVDGYLFEGEHLLVSEDGENLKSRQTPIAFLANGKFWVNNHAHILKGKKEFHNRLLCYYLESLDLHPFLTGAVQPKLNKASLTSIPIFLPENEDEQRNIVCILSSLDDKIDLLQRQNATLEAMAETLFRQWFVEEAKEESSTQLLLGDLIESVSITHKLKSNEIIFLNTSDIYLGEVLVHEYSTVKNLPGQAKKSIQKDDILFSEIRPANGRWAYIDFDADDYVVSTKLMVLRSKKRISQAFVYFYLINKQTVEWLQMLAESRSGTFPQITFEQLRDLKINVPSTEKLTEVSVFCEEAIQKIKSNNKQIRTLTTLRDVLLPKLMSGEVRVVV